MKSSNITRFNPVMNAATQLTPILEFSTNVPAPIDFISADSGEIEREANKDATVSLKVCSEFTTHTAPISPFRGTSKLALVQDAFGQPILFSTGDDKRLYCLRYRNGAALTWESYSITPEDGATIVTFDSQQSPLTNDNSSWLVLAVVVESSGRQQKLFTCTVSTKDFNPTDIKWDLRSFPNHLGSCIFNSVSCGSIEPDGNAAIVVGTQATRESLAVHYTIPSRPDDATTTHPAAPPEVYKNILDIQPGKLPGGVGTGCFVLYRREDAEQSMGCSFDNAPSTHSVQLDLAKLGRVSGICSTPSPKDAFSDLFVAAEKGIGFFPYQHPDAEPQVFLESISFKQVVVSEYKKSIILFAVSDVGELYYLEGLREKLLSSKVKWKISGLPIRADVERLSVQYNVQAGSTELMYVTSVAGNEIKHLWRSPESYMWHESVMSVLPSADTKVRAISFPAYVTTITMCNSKTERPISDYPCTLTSDFVYVTVNELTHVLSKRPVTVTTDNSGCLTIIQKVDDSLAGSTYQLSLNLFGEASITIHPSQRVISQLSQYTTPESLKNATTTTGKPIQFSESANFGAVASVLSQFGSVVHAVDSDAGKDIIPNAGGTANSTSNAGNVAFSQMSDGKIVKSSDNWFLNAAEDVAEFIGDVWESTKRALQAGFKFALSVVSKVVKLVLWINGKVFKFVISTIAGAVGCVAGFLKTAFNIDMTGFLDWLGFIFDMDKLKETQLAMSQTICRGLTFAQDLFVVCQPIIDQLLDGMSDILKEFVPDHRDDIEPGAKPENQKESWLSKTFGFIFHNPLMKYIMKFNPLAWLMEQVDDIIGDEIKLPDFTGLLKVVERALLNGISEEAENLAKLLKSVVEKVSSVATGKQKLWTALGHIFGDTLWTLFSFIRTAAKTLMVLLPDIIGELVKILSAPIKLPILSDIWEAFMGDTELSLINMLTIIPAFGANVYYGTIYGKTPFASDMLGDPSKYFPSKEQISDMCTPKENSLLSRICKLSLIKKEKLTAVNPVSPKKKTQEKEKEPATLVASVLPITTLQATTKSFETPWDGPSESVPDDISFESRDFSSDGQAVKGGDLSAAEPKQATFSIWAFFVSLSSERFDAFASLISSILQVLDASVDLMHDHSDVSDGLNDISDKFSNAFSSVRDSITSCLSGGGGTLATTGRVERELPLWNHHEKPLLPKTEHSPSSNPSSGSGRFRRIIQAILCTIMLFCVAINVGVYIANFNQEYEGHEGMAALSLLFRVIGAIMQGAGFLISFYTGQSWVGNIASIGAVVQYGLSILPDSRLPNFSFFTFSMGSNISVTAAAVFAVISRAAGSESPVASRMLCAAMGAALVNFSCCLAVWFLG